MKRKGIFTVATIALLLSATPAAAKSYGFLRDAISDYTDNPSEENYRALEAAGRKAELYDALTVLIFVSPFIYIAIRLIMKRRAAE